MSDHKEIDELAEQIRVLEERVEGLEDRGKGLARKVRVMQVAMSCPGDMSRQFEWGMQAIREERRDEQGKALGV